MGREFERLSAGAIALLTALAASAASAGGVDFLGDRGGGLRGSPCGEPGERCARISGYIKAGADVPARKSDGEPPLRIGAPPPAGRPGSAAEGSLLPSLFPLGSGREEPVR
jgi:hypothetical protein